MNLKQKSARLFGVLTINNCTMFKTYTINKIGVRLGDRSILLKRQFSTGSNSDDTINKVLAYKLTCLSKSKCDSVFKDEYRVLPAMQYTGDTAFSYYVSVYSVRNMSDLISRRDVLYKTTCCGKTLFQGTEHEKKNYMHDMAEKVWRSIEGFRTVPFFNPYSPHYEHICEFTSDEDEAGYRCWKAQELPQLVGAPRIYLDMVVTTPDRNRRILIKIVERLKFDIWWDFLDDKEEFHGNKKLKPEACLGCVSYKHLLEYSDRDNPTDYLFRMYRSGDLDRYEFDDVYSSYKRATWHHHNLDIVKCFPNVVRYLGGSIEEKKIFFKDCLNVRNAMKTSIKTGRILGNVTEEDLQEKIQFGLIFCWLLTSGFEELLEKPYKFVE